MRLRGRKGIKEGLQRQKDLVVLEPSVYKGRWHEFFGNDRPIYVELGMGKGKFISEMSRKHPAINFIGADRYDELVRKASEKAREAAEGKPNNLALALFNIEYLEDVFAPGEIERIYLNFSDPWPKKKHARRRLTHPQFLQRYVRVLNENGEIHLKTDSMSLFEFSLNAFCDSGIRLRHISLNLHAEGLHPEHVTTEYEMKFFSQGMPIYRCEAMVGNAALERHLRTLHAQNLESGSGQAVSSDPILQD